MKIPVQIHADSRINLWYLGFQESKPMRPTLTRKKEERLTTQKVSKEGIFLFSWATGR